MRAKRGERGYVYTFKLTKDGRKVIESLRKTLSGIIITAPAKPRIVRGRMESRVY